MDIFASSSSINTSFVVQNVTKDKSKKTIKIFNYPIPYMETRDLLKIPGVAEQDIRASLLKGELQNKILCQDITIVYSDIDLLQFNDQQRQFLQNSGIVFGLQVTPFNMSVIKEEDIQLEGIVDNSNKVFSIPSGKFIQSPPYKIIVYLNGVKQFYLDDYFIAESQGPGTGYDTVIFSEAPKNTPLPIDVITADYYINNT